MRLTNYGAVWERAYEKSVTSLTSKTVAFQIRSDTEAFTVYREYPIKTVVGAVMWPGGVNGKAVARMLVE